MPSSAQRTTMNDRPRIEWQAIRPLAPANGSAERGRSHGDYVAATFDWLLGSGVVEDDALRVKPAGTNCVEATPGLFVVAGGLCRTGTALQATLADPPAYGERQDEIYLDVWREEQGLACELRTAAGPAPEWKDQHVYLSLAAVRRQPGSAEIAAADIRDLRPRLASLRELMGLLAAAATANGALEARLAAVELRTAALAEEVRILRQQNLNDLAVEMAKLKSGESEVGRARLAGRADTAGHAETATKAAESDWSDKARMLRARDDNHFMRCSHVTPENRDAFQLWRADGEWFALIEVAYAREGRG